MSHRNGVFERRILELIIATTINNAAKKKLLGEVCVSTELDLVVKCEGREVTYRRLVCYRHPVSHFISFSLSRVCMVEVWCHSYMKVGLVSLPFILLCQPIDHSCGRYLKINKIERGWKLQSLEKRNKCKIRRVHYRAHL